MNPRFVFIHGNGGNDWKTPWAVWLKNELDKLGVELVFETMPDPEKARSNYWLPHMKDVLQIGKSDVVIGYSSGAVAAMRYAEANEILGSILVSPSHTDLGDAGEKESGYFDMPWDWKAIKKHQKKMLVVYGEDDPYIPGREFAYIVLQLGADKIKVPMGRHFQDRQDFMEILQYIKKTYLPKE